MSPGLIVSSARWSADLVSARAGGRASRSWLGFGFIPAVLFGHAALAAGLAARPGAADAGDQPVPARSLLPPRRQHAVPLGLRRQCRGCAWAMSASSSSSSSAGSPAGLAHAFMNPHSSGAADRRLGRDRRRRRRLSGAASAGAGLGAVFDRAFRCSCRPGSRSASGSCSSSSSRCSSAATRPSAGSPMSAASSPGARPDRRSLRRRYDPCCRRRAG